MRAAIGILFLLASGRLGEALPECRGLAPARAPCLTSFVTVTVEQAGAESSTEPRIAPVATVTIDSWGIPMHAPYDDDEKTSSQDPVGQCGPAPSKEPTPQNACHGPGNTNTKTFMRASTSSANKCAQVSESLETASTASSESRAGDPALTTGGSSNPLSSAELVSATPSHSVSPSNITSDSGVYSTGTASGGGASPSSIVPPTGVPASSPGINLSTSPLPSLTRVSASPSGFYSSALSMPSQTGVSASPPGSNSFTSAMPSPTGVSASSPGLNSSTSAMPSSSGAFYTAGPIQASGTGASDVSWQAGTSVPAPRNSSPTLSSPSSFTASGVTRGPTGTFPSSWGSASQMNSPSGVTPTGLTASGFTHSWEVVGHTGSVPGNWNSSQTVSASSGFASSGSMTSAVTEELTDPMFSSSSFPLTAGSPSGFVSSNDVNGPTIPPSDSRPASETAPAPSSVITPGTPIFPAGQPSRATSESGPGESPAGRSEAPIGTPAFPSIPSPFIPARETASTQGAAESSSPASGDSPSLPYNPPVRPLRKGTIPPFTQQGLVQNLLSRFAFPENANDQHRRPRQSSQEAPMSDRTPTSTGYAENRTSSNLSPTGSPSREYTCACALPTTAAQETSLTSSSTALATGVSATSQRANITTFSGTGISGTSSPSDNLVGTPSSDADESIPTEATGASLTPSPSANVSSSVGTHGVSSTSSPCSFTPLPSANISTPFATTGAPLTSPPGASMSVPSGANISSSFETQNVSVTSSPGANMTTPFGTTAASATPSPSSNMTTSFGTTKVSLPASPYANATRSMETQSSPIATTVSFGTHTPLNDAPYFTSSTSAVRPTPTGGSQQSSFGPSVSASSILTTQTSAFTSASSVTISQAASSTQPMATSGHPSASLTASSLPSETSGAPRSTSTAICGSSSMIGNVTIDFDDESPGQLFNPYHNFWFSEGFMLSQDSQSPYRSSSGNQLAEFIPSSLSGGRFSNISHDLAKISVGPQTSNPCFRFNLYSMSLGCPSDLPEPLCNFSIWGMRYNGTTQSEEGTGTDENVPSRACAQDRCELSLTEFNTYKNITSFIIKATAGNEAQKWWADNLVMGWTDNSCKAAECRERAVNMTRSPMLGHRLRL